MISALLYLQVTSARNRLRARLKRLKRPKYFFGAIFGGLYLVFYFSFLARTAFSASGASSSTPGLPVEMASIGAEYLGAFLLLVIVLLNWILPNNRAALAFSEAEIAFLFPAPITRRGLIQYKLIRSQVAILFSIFFLTLIWGRWRQGGHVWISLLGWWVILSALNLNVLVGSFVRTMLLDRGLTNWKRRALIIGLAIVIGVVAIRSWPSFPDTGNKSGPFAGVEDWLKLGLSTGIAPYVLYPFRLIVRPYLAPDAAAFFAALGPALVILGLHYLAVIRADVAFEEASIEFSRKVATRVETMRQRQAGAFVAPGKARRNPFKLKPTGPPAIAFLWKNLILAGSFFTLRTLIIIFAMLAGIMLGAGSGHQSPGKAVFGIMCLGLAFMGLFLGPRLLRADFRSDLPNAEQLMLYPLPGWKIVLGEVLAPVVILATGEWLLVAVGALLMLPTNSYPHDKSAVLGIGVVVGAAAGLLLLSVNLIMLLITNAVALLFPSWVRFDKNAPRGIENFGQNIILALGTTLTMLLCLLPVGLVVALGFFLGSLTTAPVLTFGLPILGLLGGLAIVAAEAGVAIYFLGHAFERFDLSGESTN